MQEWNQKLKTMRHYDHQANVYDVQYLEEQDAKNEKALEGTELSSNELVLDLGCGTGFLFQHIDKKIRLLVGIDSSQKLLREAKNRTRNLSNTVLIRADADNAPFLDHVFDRVFAITLLQNMPDPMKTISEMRRVGKPKSVFVITGLKKKFTKEDLVDLIKRAKLNLYTLKTDQRLKGHIVICTNLKQKEK